VVSVAGGVVVGVVVGGGDGSVVDGAALGVLLVGGADDGGRLVADVLGRVVVPFVRFGWRVSCSDGTGTTGSSGSALPVGTVDVVVVGSPAGVSPSPGFRNRAAASPAAASPSRITVNRAASSPRER
jgi:hypothetical protein